MLSDRLHFCVAVAAVHFTTILGCRAPGVTDVEQVHITIANLSDAARDSDSFRSFFVEGSAPDDSQRHRYREYFYEIDPPDISGNAATAIVRMMNAAGDVMDEKQWAFSKVDAQWRIRDAPLP